MRREYLDIEPNPGKEYRSATPNDCKPGNEIFLFAYKKPELDFSVIVRGGMIDDQWFDAHGAGRVKLSHHTFVKV